LKRPTIVLLGLLSPLLAAQSAVPSFQSGPALFIGLFNNLALFIVMVAVYGFLDGKLRKGPAMARQAVLGLAFGLFVYGCMQVRIPVAPGVIVDQRNAVVILAGAFGGPLAAAIAAGIAAAYRASLGGIGVWGGILGLGLSAIAGSILGALRPKVDRVWKAALCSAAAAVFILPGFLPIESLEAGWKLMRAMSVPYGSAITLGIFLGALLLDNEERRGKALAALSDSEKRHRDFFESMVDMALRIDEAGIVTMASPSCEDVLGYRPQEMVGRPVTDFYKEPALRANFISLIREKGEARNHETELVRKDGAVIIASTNAKTISGPGGSPAGYESVTRDVSAPKRAEAEKRRLEEDLRQSQKMESIGKLAGGIAHDFNNILTGILGYAEIALLEAPATGRLREDLEGIVKAGTRAKDLVNHILLFSRKSSPDLVPTRARVIVKDALSLLRASIPSTIELRVNVAASDGAILADPTAIHRALMNLCTNAAQAMEGAGGLIEVSLDRAILSEEETRKEPGVLPGPFLTIRIRDTGKGIRPEDLERIFDPYFTTKEIGKGTGMGLSIVHGIVRGHGGMIRAESLPGEGAVFTLYFPEVAVSPSEDGEKADNLPKGNERVMVVDDDPGVVEVTRLRLEALGYSVSPFPGGPEALAAFRASPGDYDLIITDQSMPIMTGEALASEAKRIRPGIPVVMCTGFLSPQGGGLEESADIDGFALKPLSWGDLAALARKALDGKPAASY
jgi:PAS domain S-box-containing protein